MIPTLYLILFIIYAFGALFAVGFVAGFLPPMKGHKDFAYNLLLVFFWPMLMLTLLATLLIFWGALLGKRVGGLLK